MGTDHLAAPAGGGVRLAAVALAAILALHAGVDAVDLRALVQRHEESQHELMASWKYDPLLICRASGLHGLVEKKAGGSAFRNVHAHNLTVVKTLRAAGIPVFNGNVQIFVSHYFRFIYVRQPKASSTSILRTIKQVFCQGRVCRRGEFLRVKNSALLKMKLHDEIWRDYFVFTVVRNPLARMLSTYYMFARYLRTKIPKQQTPGPPCHVPFSNFAHNVGILGWICGHEKCCPWRHVRGGYGWSPNFVSEHIMLQSHAFITPEGHSAVDYIGRTEAINDDWPEILDLIEQRSGRKRYRELEVAHENVHRFPPPPPGAEALPPVPEHPCLTPDVVRDNYVNESSIRALSLQFALDLVLLRYVDPPAVGDQLQPA